MTRNNYHYHCRSSSQSHCKVFNDENDPYQLFDRAVELANQTPYPKPYSQQIQIITLEDIHV